MTAGNRSNPPSDYRHMRCQPCREALSARLDGEAPGVADHLVDDHLASCAGCRDFARRSAAVRRRTVVRPAEVVPDLTGPILAVASATSRPANSRPTTSRPAAARTGAEPVPHWSRWALLAVALTQVVLATLTLLHGRDPDAPLHLARELGAWDLAFAAALLWVVVRPARAGGLVPFAAALALAMVGTAVFDVAAGRADVATESQHLLELVGLALLVVIARRPNEASPLLDGFRRPRPALAT